MEILSFVLLAPVHNIGAFDRLVNVVENTYLFKEYVSTWAAPFDNASFDATLLIIAALVLIWSGFSLVMNLIYRQKARKSQAAIEAERTEYLGYLRSEGAAGGISFDEWRVLKHSDNHISGETRDDCKNSDDKNVDIEVMDEDVCSNIEQEKEEPATIEEIPDTSENEQDEIGRLLKEKIHETTDEEEPDLQDDDFGSFISNLKARQKQDARAKEIDSVTKETTRQNLRKLENDIESAIAENSIDSKKASDQSKDASNLSNAYKKALREREKEQQRLNKMQKKSKLCKVAPALAD